MQINNSTTGIFQRFQQISNSQPNSKIICLSEESQRIRSDSVNRNADFRFVTVFEDENIRINVFDRNNHDMTPEEIEVWGLSGDISVICMRTWHSVYINNEELSEKLFNKFMQMTNEGKLDCSADDFTNAMSEWLRLLFSQWLDEMLFGMFDALRETMPDTQMVDKPTNDFVKEHLADFLEKNGFEIVCREFLDNFTDAVQKTNYQVKPNIPILSEDEILQVEPNEHQRTKKGLFYDVPIN
jgi:hypothetical protein